MRVVGGGDPGTAGLAAITAAIERTLGARGAAEPVQEAAWGRAARMEASGVVRVRSRSQLPMR